MENNSGFFFTSTPIFQSWHPKNKTKQLLQRMKLPSVWPRRSGSRCGGGLQQLPAIQRKQSELDVTHCNL